MNDVVIIGLGYIGLPTAAYISSKGIKVHGVDVQESIIDRLRKGQINFYEPGLEELLKSVLSKGTFTASTIIEKANTYIIVVPTPFSDHFEPDLSYVNRVVNDLIPILKNGDLVILESTSPVGTTNNIAGMMISKRPELRGKVHFAYCPERVIPGNTLKELSLNDRVVGGVDENSTRAAIRFYEQFIEAELHATNAKMAELCKLAENASRDVEIAFANELSLICETEGIDPWELISLANKHPRVDILEPGCGVGGHCIAVDPYFLITKYPNKSKMMETARRTNDMKTDWCIGKILDEINKFRQTTAKIPHVALCGMTFKPNVDDLRRSPALKIVQEIRQLHDEEYLMIVEPNLKKHPEFDLVETSDALTRADLVFYLVAHDEFKNNYSSKSSKQISFVRLD